MQIKSFCRQLWHGMTIFPLCSRGGNEITCPATPPCIYSPLGRSNGSTASSNSTIFCSNLIKSGGREDFGKGMDCFGNSIYNPRLFGTQFTVGAASVVTAVSATAAVVNSTSKYRPFSDPMNDQHSSLWFNLMYIAAIHITWSVVRTLAKVRRVGRRVETVYRGKQQVLKDFNTLFSFF